MRTIDADALLKRVDEEREFLKARMIFGAEHILVHHFRELIVNAPTVEYTFEEAFQKTVCEKKLYCPERPQGDIRWTDKLYVKSNGDIIDFEGRVVGHINLEDMKGGAE